MQLVASALPGHQFLCTQKLGTEMERQKIHKADRPWDFCQYPDYLLRRSSSLLAVTFPLCLQRNYLSIFTVCFWASWCKSTSLHPSRWKLVDWQTITCTCAQMHFKKKKTRGKKIIFTTLLGRLAAPRPEGNINAILAGETLL